MATLRSGLTRIAGESGAAAQRALLQTGEDIVNLTKQLAPVDTGVLRDSYKVEVISEHEIDVGTDVEYAKFVEYGTVNMEAQPHLTVALLNSGIILQTRLREEMDRII